MGSCQKVTAEELELAPSRQPAAGPGPWAKVCSGSSAGTPGDSSSLQSVHTEQRAWLGTAKKTTQTLLRKLCGPLTGS